MGSQFEERQPLDQKLCKVEENMPDLISQMDFRNNYYSHTAGQERNNKDSNNESEVSPNESETKPTKLCDTQGEGRTIMTAIRNSGLTPSTLCTVDQKPESNPDRSDPEEKDEEEKHQVPSDNYLNGLSHTIN
jgi:hypothetical protein